MSSIFEEHIKGKIFINRLFILLIFQIIAIIILITRFFYLQVIEFSNFKNKSESNNIKYLVIPPLRGNFLDRNNIKLTNNNVSYNVVLYKEKKERNNRKEVRKVIKILNLNLERQKKIYKQLKLNNNKKIVSILNNLSWEELNILENNFYKLNNIIVEKGYIRKYLYPYEFSHLIGYVAIPNEMESKKMLNFFSKDIVFNTDFKIGKNGLEQTKNLILNGTSGYKKVEVNVNNIPIREFEKKTAEPANDIKLTIDINIQKYVYEKVKHLRASVVVLDIYTGEILSMISTPSYDGNQFIDGISSEYWNELNTDEKKPMFNKTINALYAPGSTFKPIVALAALEHGWNSKQKYRCNGKYLMKKIEFRCWKKEGHGEMDIIQAITQSCNTFFINLSLDVGINKISEMATNLGFNEVFDLDLPDFKNGILSNPEWKKKIYFDTWVRADTANTSIGQGFLLANPLQLAVVISRIANGGYPIKPFLFYDNEETRGRNTLLFKLNQPIFSEKSYKIVKEGLFNVVNRDRGTASWIRLKNKEKYQICGKTGTAQVINLDFKEEMEKGDRLEEKFKNHGLFIGFTSYDNPRYAISVVIEHGGSGSVAAAPIAIDILRYVSDYFNKTDVE